jgi:hypothetical protein
MLLFCIPRFHQVWKTDKSETDCYKIFAETMEHDRDLEQEEMLGTIIGDRDDDITSQFLNDDSDG